MSAPVVPPASPTAALRPLPGSRRGHLFRSAPDQPILALDVSTQTLVASLFDPTTQRHRALDCPNTDAGIRKLLARTPAHCCWVLEPTGRYSNLAVDLARAAGRPVLMAEPRRAKAFLRSGTERAKTDRLDSRGLAEFAAARALPLYPRPTATMEQTKQLLSARRGLSQSLSRLQQQQRELPHAGPYLEAACAELRAQLQALDAQLAQVVQAQPAGRAAQTEPGAEPGAEPAAEPGAAARLDAVPGIGPVTAASVAICLESRCFRHSDQFVAYVGLDLTVRDSGVKEGKRVVSQRGDGELRRLLYLAALANLRSPHSPFRQQYDRELAKGLAHPGAVCAVARKLAKVCWSLVKHGSKYEPQRVHQPPAPKPAPPATGSVGNELPPSAEPSGNHAANFSLDTEP